MTVPPGPDVSSTVSDAGVPPTSEPRTRASPATRPADRDRHRTGGAAAGAGRGVRGAWAAWGLAVSAYFVAVFHRTSLGVASLEAERRFHTGPSVLATFVAAQLAVYAGLQIPTGAMADRFGPRRMLTAALVFLAVGEALFGWGTSVGTALAGRTLVGVGDGLTFLNVLRMVQNWFPASRYGLLTALTSLVGGVGQLVSTEPLRLSLQHLGWVATFTGSAGVTAGGGGGHRPLRAGPPRRLGPRLALRERPSMRRAVRHAMRTPGTWQGTWAHFALTGPFVVFTALWGYPFLVRAQHYSGQRASFTLGIVVVSAVLSAPFVGVLIVRAPRARSAAVKASAHRAARHLDRRVELGGGSVPAALVVLLAVVTGMCGSTSVIAFDLAREANPPERGGAATGVVNIGGFACAVFGDLAIGWVLTAVGHGGRDALGYRPAMAVVPVLITLGLVQFWRLGHKRAHVPALDV